MSDDREGQFAIFTDPISAGAGSVENLGDGRVIYTAPPDFHGDDSFVFSVRDEGRLETTATAHVDVLLGAMAGAFNVAVTELAVTGAEQEVGLDISEAVYDQIAEDLSAERMSRWLNRESSALYG